jgi:hypothetical protein
MKESSFERDARELVLESCEREGKATFAFAPLTEPLPKLPSSWQRALTNARPTEAVLDIVWAPLANKYPKTLRGLRRTLQRVGLLTTAKASHSIVYLFELEDDGGPTLRRGYSPATKLPKIASRLPGDFLAFYGVHDGWLDEDSMMGPRRSADWAPLGARGPSREFLVTFEGHGPGSLGFDLSEVDTPCYTVWNHDNPERARDVAKEIDDWMAVRMEEFIDTRIAKAAKAATKSQRGRARRPSG